MNLNLLIAVEALALALWFGACLLYYLRELGAGREFSQQTGVLFVSVACSGRTPQHRKCGGQCNYGTGLKPCECSCHEPEPEPRIPLAKSAIGFVAGKVTLRKNGGKS